MTKLTYHHDIDVANWVQDQRKIAENKQRSMGVNHGTIEAKSFCEIGGKYYEFTYKFNGLGKLSENLKETMDLDKWLDKILEWNPDLKSPMLIEEFLDDNFHDWIFELTKEV